MAVEFKAEELKRIEKQLEKLSGTIYDALKLRVHIPPLVKAMAVAFEDVSWFSASDDPEQSEASASQVLDDVLSLIDTVRADEFRENKDDILVGYTRYLEFIKAHQAAGDHQTTDQYYKAFCRSYYGDGEDRESFRDLYEHLNIRSYTEAICETVGSMMGTALSRSRIQMAVNMNKEVFIRFNLPPYHMLKKEFIPEVAKKWRGNKEFFRKYPKKSGLKMDELSASIESHRQRQTKKSHFPVDLFQKK